MFRLNAGITVILASAAVAAGCASVDASTEKSAAPEQRTTEGDYVTGSRLPRKANQGSQGVKQVSPQEWRTYQPPTPLKGN